MASPPRKKIFRKQSFRDAWLEEAHFASWLEKCEDVYSARCKVCNQNFLARRSVLEAHVLTTVHKGNMALRKSGEEKETGTSCMYDIKVKKAEIRYSIAIAEHNLNFNSQSHFIAMNKIALPDSIILQGIKLKRSKISAIIKNVINKHIKRNTITLLQNKYFSVLLDEKTETKSLRILARCVHNSNIQTFLLDYMRIKEGKPDNLFQCFLHSLEKHNLSLNNIVGISVDNANVMLKRSNSVVSKLLAANKEIAVFPCICYSMYLVVSHACKYLSSDINDFLHLICNHFFKNSKRQDILTSVKKIMNATQEKIIQSCPTRWLALSECIQRILNQWHTLFSISVETHTYNFTSMPIIFENFNNPYILAYLQFLNYVLDIFCTFNLVFQGSGVFVCQLMSECHIFIRKLGGNFLKNEYTETMENIHEIDVDDEENLLPLQEIFIGQAAVETIQELKNRSENETGVTEFYTNIQKFYINAFKGAVQRLPFKEEFLQALEFLKPEIALYISKRRYNYMQPILNKFPTKFVKEAVINEWQLLPMQFSLQEKTSLLELDILQFWDKIGKLTDLSGNFSYINIFKVAELCLSLPHSNEDVERFFSFVNEIKTRGRNRLKPETVCALTRIKLDLSNKDQTCVTYEVPEDMLKLFNSKMYEKSCIPENLQDILLSDVPDTSDTDTDS